MNPATPILSVNADLALQEYLRRKERAVLDIAARRVDPARAERNVCAWLAVLLLAGGTHRDAADLLARYADPQTDPRWTDHQARVAAASWLCPQRSWAPHLTHAVIQALTRADSAPADQSAAAVQHFIALRNLARALGLTGPFTCAAPAAQQPTRKAA